MIFDTGILAFWNFLFTWLFWTAVATGIGYAINQLTQKNPKPTTPEPDSFNVPTVREGTKYSIGFGTNWFENPLVDWWGDVSSSAIVRHYTVNQWFNNKRVYYTIGYHYGIGMNLILAQGVYDGVKQIKVGDKVAWPEPSDESILSADGETLVDIDAPTLFGGEEKEGGVEGHVRFQYGASTQDRNSYLEEHVSSDISAYRGLTTATLEQVRIGTSPYLKTWGFLLKRTDVLTDGSAQWYPAKADINNNLNAAHIIHECLTNRDWGMKISSALLPSTEWEAVADTLYDEGFGLSLKWEDQNQTLKQFVQEVLRHIDAKLYEDPTTGEIILKLVRDDYVEDDLDVYDDTDVIDVTDFGRSTIYECINTIQLKYWDIIHNKPISVPNHDIAMMNMQDGKWVEWEVEYLGITDDDLAAQVIARERQQVGSFPAMMKIKAKRTMGVLRPGDVFKLTWPILGISEMVLRVLKIDFGTLTNNAITLDCIQDVFSIQTALYSAPATSGWSDPRSEPAVAPDRKLMEATFWDVYLDSGLSDALALDADSGFLVVAAKRPSTDAYDYELYLRDSLTSDFYSDGRGQFTPNGMLDSQLLKNAQDVTITMTDAEGLYDVAVGDWCIIENEICKVLSVTAVSDQVEIARGCLDTVPEAHAASTRVWFLGTVCYISGREYTATNQPGVKILPRTGLGQLAIGDATAYNADAFNSRMNRPYPPGDFQINGSSYPSSFSGQPTITWAHRDRTQQIEEIIEHSAADIGPETNVTYTLKIYDENNLLVRTETGLTGTTYTYAWEDEMDDCGLNSGDPLNSQLRFVLYSVRDGYDSWQSYDLTVARV